MLLRRKLRDPLGHGDAVQTLRDKGGDFLREPSEDGEASLDPDLPPAQTMRQGCRRQSVLGVQAGEDLQLFAERGLAGGVVAPQTFQFRLHPVPRLHDDPDRGRAAVPKRQEATDAVDQEDLAVLLDADQGRVAVDLSGWPRGAHQLQGDRREGDLAEPHRTSSPSWVLGRERTWKRGYWKATRFFRISPRRASSTASTEMWRSLAIRG